jgi:hypothetical protein
MATLTNYLRSSRGTDTLVALPVAVVLAATCLALGYVAHVLWPRWPDPPVALNAPTLPIVISGVVFNVPPAAIRVALQRHAGTQERIDLVYLWPSLTPPDPNARPGPAALSPDGDRVFVTITASEGTLAPAERLRSIYPRYFEAQSTSAPEGLTLIKFQDASPYRGEDLAFESVAPEHFLARCTRTSDRAARSLCLAERRIGNAEITVRFPSRWLPDWRNVADRIDRLLRDLRPSGS